MTDVQITQLTPRDYAQWVKLYEGYAAFYNVALSDKGMAQTWAWLNSPRSPVTGLVARRDRSLVGLAHYRAMPSPLRGAEVGFLDDLFVAPEHRGAGIARALLDHLAHIAAERGWPVTRWITRDDNATARALYDQVAQKSDWLTYEMPPAAK